MFSLRLRLLLAVCSFGSAAFGATNVNGQRVTTTSPASSCTDPPAVTSFLTTNSTVYLYFYAAVTTSDSIRYDWLAPDGTITPGGSWGQFSGYFCFTGGSLYIANLPPAKLGSWQSRVWDNGTLLFTVHFTVNTPGFGTPAPPPHITTITPIIVQVGVNTYFTITGSGFQQGFSGALWVGSNSFTLKPGAQTIWLGNPNQVQLIVQVGGVGSPTTAFGLQIINPDQQASAIYYGLTAQGSGGGGSGGFSLSATPITTTITQGGSTVFVISAQFTGGFTGPVSNFSVSNLQQGATDWFSSSSVSYSGGTTSLVIGTTAATQVGTNQLTITASGGGVSHTASVQLVVVPLGGGTGALTLFDGAQASVATWLGSPQSHSITDSVGGVHLFHVFTVGNGFNVTAGFKLSIRPDSNTGSVLTITMPSGGSSNNQMSGGVVQALIPFGLFVNQVVGVNAAFGPPQRTQNVTAQALSCDAKHLLEFGITKIAQHFTGPAGVVFDLFDIGCFAPVGTQVLQTINQEIEGTFSIPSAGDPCDVIYPIVDLRPSSCLADPSNSNSLFGEKVLNTHQVRNLVWKPTTVLTVSAVEFHLNQTVSQALALIAQMGVTVYVNTPFGDLLLDNYR